MKPRAPTRDRKALFQWLLNICLVALVLAPGLLDQPSRLLERIEALTYDMRLRATLPPGQDTRVIIVDVDERSLREVGRWPWRRDQLATLVDTLHSHYGIASIGFDAVFADPDASTWLWQALLDSTPDNAAGAAAVANFRQALQASRRKLDAEQRFADALSAGPSVLGYYFNWQSEQIGRLPAPWFDASAHRIDGLTPTRGIGYGANLAHLQAVAEGGYYNAIADADGVVRRMPMLMQYGNNYYAGLSLALLRATFDTENRLEPTPAGSASFLRLHSGDFRLPLDRAATAYVPYRQQPGIGYVSAVDVLEQRVPEDLLSGRIVLVGTTAPGMADLRVTPLGELFPGVEIHANLILGMLDGGIRYQPNMARTLEIAVLLVIGLLLAIAYRITTPIRATLMAGFIAALVLSGNLYAWQALWVLPLGTPLLLIILLVIGNAGFGFVANYADARAKQKLSQLFGQYVPPELVEEMNQDPERFSMKSEARELTVLFSDIRDFTSISEGLEPLQLSQLLDIYLTHMTRVIYQQRGTVDKYIGDAIMAFWGAPIDNPRHADDGLRTALAMRGALQQVNVELAQQGWAPLHIGIGLNSGLMTVGNLGSRYRVAYTVVADAVNLASRLEGATKQYGVDILVGEDTAHATTGITYLEVDRIRVKGKRLPVTIYWPVGEAADLSADLLKETERFHAGLVSYREGHWEAAEQAWSGVTAASLQPLCALYRRRLAQFREAPPPADWGGVWDFTTK